MDLDFVLLSLNADPVKIQVHMDEIG